MMMRILKSGTCPYFLIFLCSYAQAGVVLNVRAVNPLDKITTEVIRYPLPVGVKAEDIIDFKIEGYYQEEVKAEEEVKKDILEKEDHQDVKVLEKEENQAIETETTIEEDELLNEKKDVPPKYEVVFDEEQKKYFLEVKVTFPPKGVIKIAINIKDVWFIEQLRISQLRLSVPEEVYGDETSQSLKEMIFKQLDEIEQRQKEYTIAQVGIEDYIKAYEKNIEILNQVRFDIKMLKSLIVEEQKEDDEDKNEKK